ncbi:hypothetical protein, conserved [Trypanosoma brucei brucei TREU927]|uniref:Transmembrane protein n=1 Tax=Trypanosoma brucei brucei (strain 927/4 GUTat10.1) TaxID=185431 RepID=Q382P5_TRYB2|nr:hypothetical protein, conserved [Trypanosoma brucei brucei TREU927]EAN80236.1 hypothetical protein, conserved [Trypanosoma brucei brucei TREU927]
MESKTWFGSQEVDGSDHGLAASDGASLVEHVRDILMDSDDDVVSVSCVNLFVKTETTSRAVIENEEYLARHSTGRDFRRGATIFSARSSSHSMSRFTTAGTFSSGSKEIEYGVLSMQPSVCVGVDRDVPLKEKVDSFHCGCVGVVSAVTDVRRSVSGLRSSKLVATGDRCVADCGDQEPLLGAGRGPFGGNGDSSILERTYGTLDGLHSVTAERFVDEPLVAAGRWDSYCSEEFPVFVDGDVFRCLFCGSEVHLIQGSPSDVFVPEALVSESNSSFGLRRAVVHVFAVFIISMLMLHHESYNVFKTNPFVDNLLGGKCMMLKLMSFHAIAVSSLLVVFCFRGVWEVPHVVLLVSTAMLVVDDFRLLYGVLLNVTTSFVVRELVQAASFVGSFASLLLFTCADVGYVAGPPFLALSVCLAWLMSRLVAFGVLPAFATTAAAGYTAIIHTVLALVSFSLAIGICLLLPPSMLQPGPCSCGKSHYVTNFLSCLGRLDPSFFIRSVACGCLVAVVSLLTVDSELVTLPVLDSLHFKATDIPVVDGSGNWPNGIAISPVVVLLLSTLALLLLCLVPSMGPFVRFVELGPATAAMVLIVAFFFDGKQLTATLAAVCAFSFAIAVGGLLRSLGAVFLSRTVVRDNFGKATVRPTAALFTTVLPVLLVTAVCSSCVALILGLTAWLAAVRGNGNDSGDGTADRRGWAVMFVVLVFSSVALALQLLVGMWWWLPRLYKRIAGIV